MNENLLLLGLLGEEDSLDVGEDTTLSDGDSGEKFVQLLVITDGELKMSRDDPGLLVVTSGISGQLEDLSSEVLEDGSQVDGGTSTHSLGVVSLAEESVDATDGELKSRAAGSALCLSLRLASFSAARHDSCLKVGSERKEYRVEVSKVSNLVHNFLLYPQTGFKPTENSAILFSLAESSQSAVSIFKSANFSVALDPIL